MANMKWPMVKLGDVCQVVSGGTPKSGISEYWGDDILWITPKDMSSNDGIMLEKSQRRISALGLEKSSAVLLPAGTVVMSSRAPIGYVGVLATEGSTNQGCKNFIPGEQIDSKYLAWYLRSQTKMLQGMGTGATFREISTKRAGEIRVPLPPKAEQVAFAEILDRTENSRELLIKQIALLDELRNGIINEFIHA